MKIETGRIYERFLVEKNPKKLYVFGENQRQQGSDIIGGGQATIRGLNNTFGFCTLKSIGEFWSDKNYNENIWQINRDIKDLKKIYEKGNYDVIVFPFYGLGTGRANMQVNCPKTFIHMSKRLLEVFDYNNLESLVSKNF